MGPYGPDIPEKHIPEKHIPEKHIPEKRDLILKKAADIIYS
jgi:hypothetical protein